MFVPPQYWMAAGFPHEHRPYRRTAHRTAHADKRTTATGSGAQRRAAACSGAQRRAAARSDEQRRAAARSGAQQVMLLSDNRR
jgi:hypothetical protein